jgi:hypothetical protein
MTREHESSQAPQVVRGAAVRELHHWGAVRRGSRTPPRAGCSATASPPRSGPAGTHSRSSRSPRHQADRPSPWACSPRPAAAPDRRRPPHRRHPGTADGGHAIRGDRFLTAAPRPWPASWRRCGLRGRAEWRIDRSASRQDTMPARRHGRRRRRDTAQTNRGVETSARRGVQHDVAADPGELGDDGQAEPTPLVGAVLSRVAPASVRRRGRAGPRSCRGPGRSRGVPGRHRVDAWWPE